MQHVQLCEDRQLLEAYVRRNDQTGLHAERAFREIVERHNRWVFAAAYRQLQDRQLAEDATQVVFILLARKATAMHGSKLSGWLFNTLQYTVRNMRKLRQRRARYEQQAASGHAVPINPPRESLSELALQLDAAVNHLSSADRTVILLRFYQDCSFEQIASTLGITEEAARKRVGRAVACLRSMLGAKSNPEALSASAAIGAGLAPAQFTHTLSTLALGAKAGAALPLTLTAATKGTAWLMTLTKIQAAAVLTSASLLVAVPATLATWHYVAHATAPTSNEMTPAAPDDPVDQAAVAAAPAAPADKADMPSDLAEFNRIYSLKPDELLKRINTPFPESRTAGYRNLAASSRQAQPRARPAPLEAGNTNGPTTVIDGGVAGGAGTITFTRTVTDQNGNVTVTQEPPVGAVMVPANPGAPGGNGAAIIMRGGAGGGAFRVMPGGQLRGQAQAGDFLPSAMILTYHEDKPLQLGFVMGGTPFRFSTLIQQLLTVAPEALEGNRDLLNRSIDGDFVVRAGAAEDQLRPALEKLFSEELGAPVSLTFKDIDTQVYVLKGKWDYHPTDAPAAPGRPVLANVPVVHIYSENTQFSYGSGAVNTSDPNKNPAFRQPLARVLKSNVLIEAQGIPGSLRYAIDDNPAQPSDPKAVLDHITEQTGLTWSQETRKMRHLFVELTNK